MGWDVREGVDERGKKFVKLEGINIISKSGTIEIEKSIFAISEDETSVYKVIGTAKGQAFGHCVYLAWRHAENFFGRVYGYKIVNPQNPRMKIAVIFYEQKPN